MVEEQQQQQQVERRNKGRKHGYSNRYGKRLLKDEFGAMYFAQEQYDKTIPVPISLPRSLVEMLDTKLDEARRDPDIKRRMEGLSRSRYIRALIEHDLGVHYIF